MANDLVITLQETEYTLIGVLLTEPRTIIPVWGVLQATDFSDQLCAGIYQAIIDLARASKVPNPYTVSAVLPSVSVSTLQALQARANASLVSEVMALAEIVRTEASYRTVEATTSDIALMAGRRPRDLDGFVYEAMQRLSSATRNKVERPSDLKSIGSEIDRLMDQPGLQGMPTGFRWLTNRIGGYKQGEIIAIVAPYKGRKSTIMRHKILAAARDGKSVGVYALEGSREGVYTDLWAMMATQIMFDELPPETFMAEAYLCGAHLNVMRTPIQHDALQRARKELDELSDLIHIADGRDGIIDLSRFIARINRDYFLYRTDVICVDHLQLFKGGTRASFFEVHESAVSAIQVFAGSNGVTPVILSQMNEAAIGMSGGSYSAGAKGGGALPAAADYVITTSYDGEKEPDLLRLKLKFARHAQPGERTYIINPPSGLVLTEHGGNV